MYMCAGYKHKISSSKMSSEVIRRQSKTWTASCSKSCDLSWLHSKCIHNGLQRSIGTKVDKVLYLDWQQERASYLCSVIPVYSWMQSYCEHEQSKQKQLLNIHRSSLSLIINILSMHVPFTVQGSANDQSVWNFAGRRGKLKSSKWGLFAPWCGGNVYPRASFYS